jgi:short-chain Z-isoprenyl diphosphate synthase
MTARSPLAAALKGAYSLKNIIAKPIYWFYERRLRGKVRTGGKLPNHLGLILDGNRRFAKAAGVQREIGYEFGIDKAHEVLQWCLELGIPAVTIWVLSTDNVARDPEEVAHLMKLFDREARNLARDPRIHGNRVRVRAIGQHGSFPTEVLNALKELEEATASYEGMLLNIAVGYGGREEIVDAVKVYLEHQAEAGATLSQAAARLGPDDISARTYTAGIPEVDFIVRTSGEIRMSGFMLWQSVYSEFYFCDVYWPGFRWVDFLRALRDFQGRKRRFGK